MDNSAKKTRKSAKSKSNLTIKQSPIAAFEHGKLPPQALELEEAVLGALMLEKDALTSVIDKLKPANFYKEVHQKIYEAICNLFQKSEPTDYLTVINELQRTGDLELDVSGNLYLDADGGTMFLQDGTAGTFGQFIRAGSNDLTIASGSTQALIFTGANAAFQGHLSVSGAQVDFTNLPTSDPSVAGRLWRSGNDVKISTG